MRASAWPALGRFRLNVAALCSARPEECRCGLFKAKFGETKAHGRLRFSPVPSWTVMVNDKLGNFGDQERGMKAGIYSLLMVGGIERFGLD